MSGRATVLSEGPFKGHSLPSDLDTILLPVVPYREGSPLNRMDTNPHRRMWIELFGKKFHVWVPVDVPDDQMAEYIGSQLLNPLGLGLWRDGEDIGNGRAEQERAGREATAPQGARNDQPSRTAYRPGQVPEAGGARRVPRHDGPGAW